MSVQLFACPGCGGLAEQEDITMPEVIIPLSWGRVDELLNHIESYLSTKQFPTILRMRTEMVVEELFSALIAAEGAQTARMRCTYPAFQKVLLQYRNEKGPITPDLTVLGNLLNHSCTYGVKAQFADGSCMITVGEK